MKTKIEQAVERLEEELVSEDICSLAGAVLIKS